MQSITNVQFPTLSLGSKGEYVKFLQEIFHNRDYDSSARIDGIFGPRTEATVKEFQRNRYLKVDGIVGPATWNALLSEYSTSFPTLRRGSTDSNTGGYVTVLQERLNLLSYPVAIDGIFGPKTENAVKKFQKDRGFPVDGIVGPRTWNGLYPLEFK
ncbi:peptidoglycan-binding domain-containing protein [Floridanema aerugineum]|uniref:Peptidoglycan-binding protein n=1 Tax=Floridaenema aerugineum BLCC-F46 TaxID=3153654 RepID=A0ABV4X6E4_9CYAN